MTDPALSLTFPAALVEAIAAAVADELEARGHTTGGQTATPWLDVHEAAAYLRCKPQRVYDLVAAGDLTPAKDGRRSLFRCSQLDAYLETKAGA